MAGIARGPRPRRRYGGRRVTARMHRNLARRMSDESSWPSYVGSPPTADGDWISKSDVQHHSISIGVRVVSRRFGSWAAAVEAARLALTPSAARIPGLVATWTIDQLFDYLDRVYEYHRRLPRALTARTEARWVVGFEVVLGALLAASDGGLAISIPGGGE